MGVDQIFWTNQKNYLICIIALLSPQMLNKVISEIVMGTHIFNFNGSLTIVLKSFNVKHWIQHQTKALNYNWNHLLWLNYAKSHTLWEYYWYGHVPLSTWILNDYKLHLKHPKTRLHIFLAPSCILQKCCFFSPCGSWIVWTKMLHWR